MVYRDGKEKPENTGLDRIRKTDYYYKEKCKNAVCAEWRIYMRLTEEKNYDGPLGIQ